MAKICNAVQRNHIEQKIEKILRNNQNGFRRNQYTTSQILTIRRILEGSRRKKNFDATILFFDVSKAFDTILRGKMELILAYGLHKENVAVINITTRK